MLTNSVRASFTFSSTRSPGVEDGFGSAMRQGTHFDYESQRLAFSCALRTTAATLYARDGRILALIASPSTLVQWSDAPRIAELALKLASDAPAALRTLTGAWILLFIDETRGSCLLATDRAARRSPCFAITPERVFFGLSAADVAAQDIELQRVRVQSIYDYLYAHVIPAPHTFFEGVQRLRPGEFVHATQAGVTRELYWRPSYWQGSTPTFRAAKSQLVELLEASVASESHGGPAGCFLSGGTDSSTIAGMLAKLSGEARTYSIGFDAPGFDEMGYARIASRHFRTQHHEYYITPDDLVAGIPGVAAAYDQPFGNSSALPAFYCARLARSDGVSRLLGGDGGDEIFGGNTRYAYQKLFDAYPGIRLPVADRMLGALIDREFARRTPGLRKVRSYVHTARTPMPGRLHSYNLIDRIGAERIISPALMELIDTTAPRREEAAYYDSCKAPSLVDRMLHLDWKYTLADNDLPKVIGTCDLAGVAVGFPFLNERLVEFANGLPPQWKVKGFRLRYFFKAALRDFLPREIIVKKKHGFGLPFGIWLLRHAGLQRLTFQALDSLVERGIVRHEFVRATLRPSLTEHASYYGELAWILMMLEHWLQHHQPTFTVAR